MRRAVAVVLAGVVFGLAPGPGLAEPFTVETLLGMEAYGQVSVDRGETRLVFERMVPFDRPERYEHDYHNLTVRSELFTASLADPRPAVRLLDVVEGTGHRIGSWSPSGRRLLVYRLRDRVWQAGVVEAASGSVRWLDVTPDLPSWGRTAQWRTDDELVMIVRTDGLAPWLLRAPWEFMDRLPERWALTQAGEVPSRTILGSGATADLTPRRGPGSLVTVDARTGRTRDLGAAAWYDMELSPDGRHVAAAAFGESLAVDPDVPFLQGDFPRGRTLHVVDLESGDRWTPEPSADLLPNLLAWSADGTALLVWVRDQGRPWEQGRLRWIDPGARHVAAVSAGPLVPAFQETGLRTPVVIAGWLGDSPALFSRAPDGREDWTLLTDAGPVALTAGFAKVTPRLAAVTPVALLIHADAAVWAVTPSGRTRLGTGDEPVVLLPPDVVDRGQRFFFNDPPRRDWAAVRRADGRAMVLGQDGQDASAGLDGAVVVGRRAGVSVATDTRYRQSVVVTPAGREPVSVSRINAGLGATEFARRRAVHHRGPDGEALTSWLYLPATQPDGGLPPLVVVPYPGVRNDTPDPASEPLSTAVGPNVQVMAGAGFAVLVPSLPRERWPGEPSEDMADQILSVVDAAAASGDFDPGRIGLWGHSFGAHAALTAAAQSSRFSAVVAANGTYDLASKWGTFQPAQRVIPDDSLSIRSSAGWTETGQGRMGGPPWTDPDRYRRNSPLFMADQIRQPVLLITADRDYTPMTQAEIMFTALYRQNRDAMLVTYWGEGHVMQSPANIRDMNALVLGWLADRLGMPGRRSGVTTTPAASFPSSPGS